LIALSKGEVHRAQELLTQLRAREYSPALTGEYQSDLASIARGLAEMGQTSASLELLSAATTQDPNALVALAEDGDVAQPDAALQELARDHGQETLWKTERIPEVRAALLLAKHEPQQAVSALEATLRFDGLTFGPAWLRGEAYVALGKAPLAQAEFHKITEHPYIDPLSNEFPLAVLASARAFVAQNQTDKAREQFDKFFDLWKNADADLPLLQAARAEYESHTPVEVTLTPQ
jgi:eukaryotic-like serine/threonine-protein kinase